MSKIGVKIIKISSGVQELESFNVGEWTRKVSDIRTDIKALSGKALEEGAPFLMVSFVRDGSIVTVCHDIPGRAGDLVSAWIFFPVDINISAEEQKYVIERVNQEIAKPNVENWDAIGQLCDKEYPLKQGYFNYKESVVSNPCAVRYYGTGTDFGLQELLGDRLYQDYYTGHRYVFFLDAGAGILADDRLVNYTNDPLREFVVLTPPQLPENVTVKLNDKDFSKPIFGVKGEKATLTFYRPGFSPIAFQIAQGGPMPDPGQLSWKCLVTPSFFYVTDNENRDLNVSSRIRIKGQWLTVAGISISNEESSAVEVEVTCPGCEPLNTIVNLTQQLPIRMVLEREKVNIVYVVDGKECPGMTECPKGYEYTETRQGKKIIRTCFFKEPEPKINWKMIAIIGSAAALLIGLAIGVLLHKIISDRSSGPEQVVVSGPNGENKSKKDTEQQKHEPGKVYECLNKDTWKKSELDKEKDLEGFYEDLSKCKVDNLTGKWAEKIDPVSNPQWGKVLDTISKYKKDLPQERIIGTKDSEIGVDYYIVLLKKKISPQGQSGSKAEARPPKRVTAVYNNDSL